MVMATREAISEVQLVPVTLNTADVLKTPTKCRSMCNILLKG